MDKPRGVLDRVQAAMFEALFNNCRHMWSPWLRRVEAERGGVAHEWVRWCSKCRTSVVRFQSEKPDP